MNTSAFRYGMVLVILSMLTLAAIYLWNPIALGVLRNITFDQYQRWQPRAYQPAPVHIIDIDEASLRRIGQWPWPRSRIAELVSKLQEAQAAAIVFDVIFAERDRTAPLSMLDIWLPGEDIGKQLALLPDPDQTLAQAIGRGKVVLGFALDQEDSSLSVPITQSRYVVIGPAPQPYLHAFSRALGSLPSLQAAASGNGAITFIPDADGVVRKVPLLLRQGQHLLPSLSAEALRVAQSASNYTIRSAGGDADGGSGLTEVRIGKHTIPTTPQGEIWLHYSNKDPGRYIPAWKVLAGEVPPQLLKENILLIGASAHGIMDLRFSPVHGAIPGVEVHAQMLEQVLTNSMLNRPGWARAIELLIITVGGLSLGIITLSSNGIRSLLAMLAALCAVAYGAWLAFSQHGLLLDPLIPGLALIFIFTVSSLSRHMASERHQRWVRQAFSRYISPNLVNYLIAHPDALVLSARRTDCSFIFTDLAGFTSLMETMDPRQASDLLNVYLDRMIAIAFTHQGTLDRIMGDAVAIMFSAPLHQADHQRRALQCALDMAKFADEYLAELKAKEIEFCQTRIGIHSGEVVVGNFGGAAIFDYRALGDPVNTASRLEGANKQLGTLICVSEATLSGCRDIPARPIGRLLLKGKSKPIMTYEPLFFAEGDVNDGDYKEGRISLVNTADTLSTGAKYQAQYLAAYELMREENPGALAAFEHLHTITPKDRLALLHLNRLRQGQTGDLIVLDEK